MPAAVPANPARRFQVERTVTDDVTLLQLNGVVDEGFDAEKTAASVRTKKVVLDFSQVRRFASWGMSRWTEFARECAAKDLYIVEASTHAVNQFHMVTGLIGHAKLVSFYAAYRCDKCGEVSQTVIVVPTDRELLLESEQACVTCGGTSRQEPLSATLCSAIAEQPPFDIDDDVIAFLRSRYRYNITPDLQRFRAARTANSEYVFMRLTGNVHGIASEALARNTEKVTVLDVGGLIMSTRAKGFAAWRAYVRAALPNVSSLQLLDCPVGFLDQGVTQDDFPKLKVRTFALEYLCDHCQIGTTKLIDVAQNLEDLVEGRYPVEPCGNCAQPMMPNLSPELAHLVPRLPVREHDPALDRFVARARSLPPQDLEDGLKERAVKRPKAGGGPTRALYVASGLMVVVTAALIAFGLGLWKKNASEQTATPNEVDDVVAPKLPTAQRPAWIVSDAPLSGYCQDLTNRLMCVGVSGYRQTEEEGLIDANEAALDELLFAVGLRATDPFFKATVLPSYSEARAKALADLQLADTDRKSKKYTDSASQVRAARKRLVEILKSSGGAAVPAQRSDWYWEKYAAEEGGDKTETLVFVKYDVPVEQLKALVDTYTVPVPVVDGVTATTATPSLAWRSPDFTGGAMIATATGKAATSGLAPAQIVTTLGGTKVRSVTELVKNVQSAQPPLVFGVTTPEGTTKELIVVR